MCGIYETHPKKFKKIHLLVFIKMFVLVFNKILLPILGSFQERPLLEKGAGKGAPPFQMEHHPFQRLCRSVEQSEIVIVT